MLAFLASRAPMAPGGPTPKVPAGPPGGWWSQSGTGQAVQQAGASGINWPGVFGIVAGVIVFLMLFLAIKQGASSGKGDVKKAGSQSAVMGIAVGWFTVAMVLGAMTIAVMVGNGVRMVMS